MFALNTPNTFILGVVGSTAYGLATSTSDIDRYGVYAAPTEEFHGLERPPESVRDSMSDTQLHEIGKFCALALNGNPSTNELLWLDDYEVLWPIGEELVAMRSAFLSAPRVRGAYLVYATKQLARMRRNLAADREHAEKNGRHLLRLIDQGYELYVTGRLRIRLDNPERYRKFGKMAVAAPGSAATVLQRAIEKFDQATTLLPDEPDTAAVDKWLRYARLQFLKGEPCPAQL